MEGIALLPKAKQYQMIRELRVQKYTVIKECSESLKWDITWMCGQLKVSRQAYYKWKNRKESELVFENKKVLECTKEIADSNNCLLGAMKMTYVVKKKLNSSYNHKRIYRLMCINDLISVFRKEKRYRWKRSAPQVTAENTLNRKFEVSKPNEVWCADVTEIAYPGIKQKAYISAYLDLYDRSVVGLSVSKRNDTALTNESLMKAIEANPKVTPLHHSDRGFQYTREVFKKHLEDHKMKQSMSKVSRCIDNGPMEGFQGILKDMLVVLYPNLKTYEQLEQAIYNTLDYYHKDYPQMRFKGLTALEVRSNALNQENPKRYPITPNPQVVKFWNHIEEVK
ncbi:MAG: IS3 family transposase [Erysipelotrichaceae bacterium]